MIMNVQRFDRMIRLLATGASRRAIVRALAGSVAGGLVGLVGRGEAKAAQVEIEVGPIALCLGDLSLEVCLGLPHVADARCEAGQCVIEQCEPGWADCDGQTASGCETPLGTAANCGACGDVCASGVCSNGDCQIRQPPCDDGIPCGDICCRSSDCQTGLCVDGACYGQPANDGEACEDDDPCTTEAVCQDGVCVGSVIGCPVCTACRGGDCVADATRDGAPCGDGGVCRDGDCQMSQPPPCIGGVLCADVCCPPETVGCTELKLPDGTVIIGCLCPEGFLYDDGKCLPCADTCTKDEECCSENCCAGACCGERHDAACASGISCAGTCCLDEAATCDCIDGACRCRCPEGYLDCDGTCVLERRPNGGIACCSDADCPDDPEVYCCLDEAACGNVHYCVITID